jgi:hypothetical protein
VARDRGAFLRPATNKIARLRLLLAVHLLLATLSAWQPFIPMGQGFAPLRSALVGASVAPTLLLAFWCGLGTSSRTQRWLGGFLGVGYLAIWWPMQQLMWRVVSWRSYRVPVGEPTLPYSFYADQWVRTFVLGCLLLSIFAGALLIVRRWKAELRYSDRPDGPHPAMQTQYSLRHLLIGLTIVAAICGLSRGARDQGPWQGWAQQGLFVMAFLAVLLVSIPAALAPRPVGGRVGRALLVSLLASVVYSLAMPSGDLAWWMTAWWWILLGGLLWIGLPAAIFIASLLVVRSCGYRLVPRSA